MSVKSLALRFFTWWNSETWNTQLWTWLYGKKVGEDAEGNVFFQDKTGKRRWVIYNGEAQASRVTPEWHGWLHHTWEEPPTKAPLPHRPWEKPHLPNLTGTDKAYFPEGSLYHADPVKRRDYDAWQPD